MLIIINEHVYAAHLVSNILISGTYVFFKTS